MESIPKHKLIGIAITVIILLVLAGIAMLAQRAGPSMYRERELTPEEKRIVEEVVEAENTLTEDEKERVTEDITAVKNTLTEEQKKRIIEDIRNQ